MSPRPSEDAAPRALPLAALLALAALGGCGEPGGGAPQEPASEPRPAVDDPAPPTAVWQPVEALEADLAAVRHASDGGGRARLVEPVGDPPAVPARSFARFVVDYTAGPLGVAQGGAICLMPEAYWDWSVPQTERPDQPGFTRVSTAAEGVDFETFTVREGRAGYLVARVQGRALAAGETVRLEYGADGPGALVDRHSGRGARLWISVDGDGDGVRELVEDSPSVDVLPGPPVRLVLTGPSVARPGERVRFTLAALDAFADVAVEAAGSVRLSQRPPGWEVPETLALAPDARGVLAFEVTAAGTGVARLRATLELAGGGVLEDEAAPLWVVEDAPRILWGDLHGHSGWSDGTGHPEDYYRYARDVANLDVAALTDHDHYGTPFLDQRPERWEALQAITGRFHEPGRFVTLVAYEWTSWIHGHRHVLYFSDSGALHSSLDPAVRTPRQLWDALRGQDVLTLAHHSAGEPVPTNWTFRPDPELEPVTEVMSVHGSSEAADSPRLVRGARRGNFVRDQLERGVQLGFVGSGDTHDGHPGLGHLSPVYGWLDEGRVGTGGLAGILAEERTRPAVLEALRARRTYATSGPRILLRAQLAGHAMGASLSAADLPEEPLLSVVLIGTAGLERLELVRPGRIEALGLEGELKFVGAFAVTELAPGDFVYLRVTQEDGGLAWSSPWFVE